MHTQVPNSYNLPMGRNRYDTSAFYNLHGVTLDTYLYAPRDAQIEKLR